MNDACLFLSSLMYNVFNTQLFRDVLYKKERCNMKPASTWLLLLAGIMLCMNPLLAEGERWGNDITIYSGPVSCFDVDYTMDGTIFLGFQKLHLQFPLQMSKFPELEFYHMCFSRCYTSVEYYR